MRLFWSVMAQGQLREARAFIARDDPDAARRIVAAIQATADRLAAFPNSGIALESGRRAAQVRGTPFRLIYAIEAPDRLRIIAVWHGARRWPYDPV